MLGYQHIYHAGNFADVHKHGILAHLLSALTKRHPALFILDTHAGRGLYDLNSPEAQKKQEFLTGVAALCAEGDPSGPLADFLRILRKHNPEDGFKTYPGSAMLAQDLSRPQDRLVFAELHPGEFSVLQKNFTSSGSAELFNRSGFDCMAEMIPPSPRKGLVIIDPPYEIKSDYAEVPKALAQAWKKWPQGSFLVWYPLLPAGLHEDMLLALQRSGIRDTLVSEVRIDTPPQTEAHGMYGSGIILVNPPWPEQVLDRMTKYIAGVLPAKTSSRVFWLDNASVSPENGKLVI